MAEMLSVQLDIVLGHETLLAPDFSSNRFAINLHTRELHVFEAVMQLKWWTNCRDVHAIFDLCRYGGFGSMLTGGQDLKSKAKFAMISDLKEKISRVLLLSFQTWKEQSLKYDEKVCMEAYLAYVYRMIQYRQANSRRMVSS